MDSNNDFIELDLINRSALLIKHKQPFIDWVNSIQNDNWTKDHFEPGIYLVPEFEDDLHLKQWIENNFDRVFCNEMNGWYTDPSLWPRERTFILFQEWFEYSYFSFVWDTDDTMINYT
jgi:hypothetical protein